MASNASEAYLLLTLPGAVLTTPEGTQQGTLGVECVTVLPSQDVFIVLRVGSLELPLEPGRIIQTSMIDPSRRVYQFRATQSDPTDLLSIAVPPPDRPEILEDIESFEGILAQYADFRGLSPGMPTPSPSPSPSTAQAPPPYPNEKSGYGWSNSSIPQAKDTNDLRGHLILVNNDNGEIVGQLDNRIQVKEDPVLYEKGHENDAVVIEVAESAEGELTPLQAFAQAIPPDQHNWMTKGATVVSHVISHGTNLLVTVVSSASNYYINNSKPAEPKPDGTPSRAAVILSSERTRKNLQTVHAFSGQAVKVSAKTLGVIDDMIHSAVGKKKKGKGKGKQPTASQTLPPIPSSASRTPSPGSPPSRLNTAPPSCIGGQPTLSPTANGKPPLPPRNMSRSPSPAPPPPLSPRKVSTTGRLILSADLVLSTLDNSAKQLLDVGGDRLSAVVGHKYGDKAGNNTKMLTGAARNVGVVYVDMRGIGRRALIKKVGKEYVTSRINTGK